MYRIHRMTQVRAVWDMSSVGSIEHPKSGVHGV